MIFLSLLHRKCSFITGATATGKTKFMNSKIMEFDKNEQLYVFTQFAEEYENTLNEKYGIHNVQDINIDYNKKLDFFSFHYPRNVENFRLYFNTYVETLIYFLKSAFGVNSNYIPSLRSTIIEMFKAKNITSLNEPVSSKTSFFYNDFYSIVAVKIPDLSNYFSYYSPVFLTKEDSIKHIFNPVSLDEYNKNVVLINFQNSMKYKQIYLNYVLFKIQTLDIRNPSKTNIIFDEISHPHNLFYFFESPRFSMFEFYFISQNDASLTSLYRINGQTQDFYLFKTRQFISFNSFLENYSKLSKEDICSLPIKLASLKNGEYFSLADNEFLSFKLN